MVGDIDSIPLNKEFYVNQVENLSDDKFVNYCFSLKTFSVKEYNLSYNLATSSLWKEIFNINNLEDINQRLLEWNKMNGIYLFDSRYRSKCKGFHFDKQILFKYLEDWKNNNKDRLVLFDLDENKRFKPNMLTDNDIWNRIKNGEFNDNIF